MLVRICTVLILVCPVWAQVHRDADPPSTSPPLAGRAKGQDRTKARNRAKGRVKPKPPEAVQRPDKAPDSPKPKPPAKKRRPRRQATRPAKPKTKPTPRTRRWLVKAERGMLASDSIDASRAGAEILKDGGNAIDAAVATSFALGVTRPYSTGLGGGGFAVIYLSRAKETIAVDFRETAPGDATWDMFVKARKKDPNGPSPSQFGGLAVGVPGLLAGADHLLEEFGTMQLSQVIDPAIELAERGFKADKDYVSACAKALRQFRSHPDFAQTYETLHRTLLNRGQPIKGGQLIRRPELAAALRLIASVGPQAFYDGQIGDAIVQAVKRAGGVMAIEDLLGYRVRERQPIRFKYRDYQIVSMPPPSSGGIVIAEVLNILSNRSMADPNADDPHQAAHVFVEACKHAFADRSRWLGDPAYVNIPQRLLTGTKYAASLAKGIDPKRTKSPKSYGSVHLKDDGGTSHFCVVDADDNVVAWTETINLPFGSFVVTDRFGIILNNEMDDFSAEPGKPDAFGLRTSDRNAVAPGKRPLSSMSPTIVLDDRGLPILTLGASGGPRIISSVLNVLINVLDYEMTLGEAMEATRIHHQWSPNEIRFDVAPDPDLAAAFKKRGHRIGKRRASGVVQAIEWALDNTLLGASDPKKGGRPAGH